MQTLMPDSRGIGAHDPATDSTGENPTCNENPANSVNPKSVLRVEAEARFSSSLFAMHSRIQELSAPPMEASRNDQRVSDRSQAA